MRNLGPMEPSEFVQAVAEWAPELERMEEGHSVMFFKRWCGSLDGWCRFGRSCMGSGWRWRPAIVFAGLPVVKAERIGGEGSAAPAESVANWA